jgi:hypothetical protein
MDHPVFIRDEGYACHFSVESVDFANLILACLSNVFAFKTSEPINVEAPSSQCSFRVAYGSQLSHRQLTRLLTAIPGVRLAVGRSTRDVALAESER